MAGRKRKFNPKIPAHINQNALPEGIYWDDNRWFIYEPHPEGGRPRKRTVADKNARLSELHAAVEDAKSTDVRGTLAYLCARFEESLEFKKLGEGSRKNYKENAEAAKGYILADGSRLGDMAVAKFTVPMMQRLVETIAAGRPAKGLQPALKAYPSKANHVLRYLRRMFNWGIRHGYCLHNPCQGVKQVEEVADGKMPSLEAFAKMQTFLQVRGRRKAHTRGCVPPYLHAVSALAYNLRARGIEVNTLTDAHYTEAGIITNRRKGSRDNVTLWNEEMRAAWNWLVAYRTERMEKFDRPIPIRAEQRRLLVTESGTPLSKSALDSAWQRAMNMAIRDGELDAKDRYSLHGLKHRGITDTEGNIGDAQDGAGHKSPRTTIRYHHVLPVVAPPKPAKS